MSDVPWCLTESVCASVSRVAVASYDWKSCTGCSTLTQAQLAKDNNGGGQLSDVAMLRIASYECLDRIGCGESLVACLADYPGQGRLKPSPSVNPGWITASLLIQPTKLVNPGRI